MIERRTLLGAGMLGAFGVCVGGARAQAFPSKPVRWIVPFAAGGNYDVTSRLVGEAMARHLGQSVVVDNKPGGGGVVGMEAAAQAPADGHTVVMGSFNVLYVAPLMARKPSMVPQFAPLSLLTTVPMVVVARTDGKFADWAAMMAGVRTKPGAVSVGHAGNGTSNHLDILRLQMNEKVSFNVVPYRGSGPGLTDLLGGQIDLYVDQLTTSLPHIKAGKLKALAVVGLERVAALPDAPTLKEVGATAFDGGTTAGLLARAETPKSQIEVLNKAVVAALKDPAVAQRLVELGAVVRPSTPEVFAAYIKNEEAAIGRLAEAGLLKPE